MIVFHRNHTVVNPPLPFAKIGVKKGKNIILNFKIVLVGYAKEAGQDYAVAFNESKESL